jgi:hypothetical protein
MNEQGAEMLTLTRMNRSLNRLAGVEPGMGCTFGALDLVPRGQFGKAITVDSRANRDWFSTCYIC